MGRAFYFALLLLGSLIFQTMPAGAQDHLARNPMLLSAQIRALRYETSAQALQARYRLGEGRELQILAAANYGAWMEAERFSLFDFKLRRTFVKAEKWRRFFNRSMYAEAHNVIEQMKRRVGIMKAAQQRGDIARLPPDIGDTFWMATATGVPYGRDLYGGASRRDRPGGGFALIYKGETVLEFEPEPQQFPARMVEHFYRTIERGASLHPGAVEAMLQSGFIPKSLKSTYWDAESKQFVSAEFTLQAVEVAKTDYPMPPGWWSVPDPAMPNYFAEQFLPLMHNALRNSEKAPRRSFRAYRIAMSDLVNRSQIFDALLLMHEGILTQQIPCPENEDACAFIRATAALTSRDASAALLNQARQLSKQNKQHEAINLLLQIPREGLTAGHIIDIYQANNASEMLVAADIFTPEQLRDIEGRVVAGYLAGLRGNAWISGVYKDIGDFMAYKGESFAAWQSWDIGRSLFGGEQGAMINDVGRLEQQLAKQMPWRFDNR